MTEFETNTDWENRGWELTKQLVSIDSSDPGAYEGEIGNWIYAYLCRCRENLGSTLSDQIQIIREEVLPGRFNVMARIPGKTKAPGLIYICHMDTVMLGEGWSEETPPLGAVVRETREEGQPVLRLYGRGACDMKSGLSCALAAFEAQVGEMGKRGELPERSFSMICTVDEEDFMRGVEQAIRSGWITKEDWVLDTEPTDGQIQVAHKGRTWFELTVTGITAHASNPWKGADAIAAMAEVISSIRKEIAACPSHHDLGISTVTFGQIQGGYRPYVVPDCCKVWIDMRLVPPVNTEAACEMVDRAVKRAEREIPGIRGSYVITGDRPYVEKDPDSSFLACLAEAVKAVTGEEAVTGAFNGYTDTAVIAGMLGNHNCMSYGPGSLELAHKPDESVPYGDVNRVQKVLAELAEQVLWRK